MSQESSEPSHLIVLIHGLNGNPPKHFNSSSPLQFYLRSLFYLFLWFSSFFASGSPWNWDFVQSVLTQHLDHTHPSQFAILNSETNSGVGLQEAPRWSWSMLFGTPVVPTFKTHQGVDVGALRLVEEVEAELRRRPTLRRLTLIGHSLGGIYAR